MKLRPTIWILAVTIVLCGCSSRVNHINSMIRNLTISDSDFLTITNGTTLDYVTSRFGVAIRHEFTVRESDDTFTVASCFVPNASGIHFYLLFSNNTLTKVFRPPSRELEKVPYDGTTWTRVKSWPISEVSYISKTISAPALTHDQMISDLHSISSGSSGSWNVFPAFLISGYLRREAPKAESGYETNQALIKRYDGFSVAPGVGTNDLLAFFGQPVRDVQMENNESVWMYWNDDSSHINPLLAFDGMAVVLDATGHVVAIYSHNYFNQDWEKELKKQ